MGASPKDRRTNITTGTIRGGRSGAGGSPTDGVFQARGIEPARATMAVSGRRNADDRLALELATGKTVADAAAAAGVSERTAYRRLDDPEFRGRLTVLRGEMVRRAAGRLADGSTNAAETLTALLSAKSEAVRLGAARSILELGTKLRDSTEIEERIVALEDAATHAKKLCNSPFAPRNGVGC
jgi:hypothetical protein